MTRSAFVAGAAVVLAAVITGCSSLPGEIRNPPRDAVAFHEGASDPDAFKGEEVRWGGEIIGVDNRDSKSWIEVLQRPLDVDGRPLDTDRTGGRFVVRVDGFLDPAVYAEGRDLTVHGTIERGAEGAIGNQPYLYTIIDAETTYLWDRDGD
ncbi:Slp family lipoprotein [Aquisalimonas sp.]|uniref:Slp family lipoprotein n=1 Tax=Aquisalimonas sp. TaxID=1872621 RepID=UPI0025BEE649|nr:Slp family lipoprotein [Aquisalimonas sp.]